MSPAAVAGGGAALEGVSMEGTAQREGVRGGREVGAGGEEGDESDIVGLDAGGKHLRKSGSGVREKAAPGETGDGGGPRDDVLWGARLCSINRGETKGLWRGENPGSGREMADGIWTRAGWRGGWRWLGLRCERVSGHTRTSR